MKLWAGLILWCFSYLASADSLRIVSSEFIPHNGEHLPNQGYAIQMLREIFASQQQEVHFEFLPWPRALLQAKEGEAVAIVTIWYSAERAKYLNYPTPLYSNKVMLYHNKQRPVVFTQLDQLPATKLRLGMVRGYSYPEVIEQLPFDKVEVNTDLESLKMLALGRVDLVVCEQQVAEYILKTELASYSTIETTGAPVEERPMYIAFSKAHPHSALLQQKYEKGLLYLKQQHRLEVLQPNN
jgi:polar amino acid transport system substrate-binding protein